jgi:hypothetical protein
VCGLISVLVLGAVGLEFVGVGMPHPVRLELVVDGRPVGECVGTQGTSKACVCRLRMLGSGAAIVESAGVEMPHPKRLELVVDGRPVGECVSVTKNGTVGFSCPRL